MTTVEERREVARRLRGIKDTREGCGHEMCCDLWAAIFDSDYRCTGLCDECEVAVLDSLAGLIEPSIPADPGEAGLACVDAFIREHTEKPVDRDALLALADDLDYAGAAVENVAYIDQTLHESARRIREACGEACDE